MSDIKVLVEEEEAIDVTTKIENDFLKGEKGEPNILTIGTVQKGEQASASIIGDSPNQILNLVLPKGDKGDRGEQGIQGEKGEPGDVSLNQIKTTQTTNIAEALTITDCAGVNGKLDIKSGKSEQETRSGKNLLNILAQYEGGYSITSNGLTVTFNQDGSITVDGTPTADTIIKIFGDWNNTQSYCNLDSSKEYYLSCNYNTGIAPNFRDANSNKTVYSFKSITGFDVVTYLALAFTAGTTWNKDKILIQLEEGKEQTEWEPYGVSPSQDYPSDIRNVGDNINLFNKSTATDRKYIGTTGDLVAADSTVFCSDFIKVQPNTKVCITHRDDWNSFAIYDENKTFISRTAIGTSSIYSTPENCHYIRINGLISDKNIIKVEISEKPTSYSEYGCGSVGFKAQNKNIIDIEDVTTTINGITVTKSGDTFTINGTASGTCQFKFIPKDITILKGQYTLSNTFISGTKSGTANFNIRNKEDDASLYPRNLSTSNGSTVCELDNEIIYGIYVLKGAIFSNYTFKIQLEEGDTATDFIEHKSQKVIFPLEKGQLLHKGDYLAEDGIHQVRKTFILNGIETFSNRTILTNTTRVGISLPSTAIQNENQKCSHFNILVDYNSDTEHFFIGTTTLWLYIPISIGSGETQIKNWLAEQYANGTPVTVEYDLAEEIVIPYTDEQKEAYYQLQHLLMYKGYTSIVCIDKIKPDIQVTYSYNNEINTTYGKKIDTLEAKIRKLEQMITSQSEVVE